MQGVTDMPAASIFRFMKNKIRSCLAVCAVLFFVLPALPCPAKPVVQFRLSKPYCLLNFLETCSEKTGTSTTLRAYARDHRLWDATAFPALLRAYNDLQLDYTYSRDQLPESRTRSRYGNTKDLVMAGAVRAATLAQFSENITGLLPNSDQQELLRILKKVEPYYDSLIWRPYAGRLQAQLAAIRRHQPKIDTLFAALCQFYQSSWSGSVPFIVTLSPIPGRSGNTTATPYANSLCVGVLTDGRDEAGTIGVILHEMCHVLYNEQPAAFQQQIDGFFAADTSRYRSFAYTYLDEGLATACGNGWAREVFAGSKDTGQWYDDPYINTFGHALYPLVKGYVNAHRAIDSNFIVEAIRLFSAAFPRAPYDYNLLLNSVHVYSDAADRSERAKISEALHRYFLVSSYDGATPVADAGNLETLRSSPGTQIVILHKDQQHNYAKLLQLFPRLATLTADKPDEDFTASFLDGNRAIVVIKIADLNKLDGAFKQLAGSAYIDLRTPYHAL